MKQADEHDGRDRKRGDGGVTRRGFLRALASTGAAAPVILNAGKEADAFSLLPTDPAPEPERLVPSFCELCFWNCGLLAGVRDNRVVSLTGHPDAPNARGKLCGRGNAGAAFVTDGDRLKYPMVRVGKRGEGKFRRVGWPTAYRTIAQGFERIKQTYGPQALGLFYHGSGGAFLRTMMVAYGSPNYAGPSYAQCKGPRDVGFELTFGEQFASPEPLDLERTACMVLLGSHLGENAHNSQVQAFVEARARGARLIVLDPRLSTPANMADLWLSVRPGSDLAVLLAWIHLLIRNEAYDAAFVRRRCTGFEALKEHVRPFTPRWAAEQAGVPEADIRAAYRLIEAARPAVVVHPGRHVVWYGEADTQRARAEAILTALLGAWYAPGGIYRASRPALNDYPTPDFPDLPPHVDAAAGRYPFAREVTTNGIRDATRTGKPYPVKGWFVYATNLLQAVPNVKETLEAIEQLDMLVVCDILPTEITQYADVLLPEDVYLERYDDIKRGPTQTPFLALRQPAVKPVHDTRPAWRIAKELGTELGVGDFFAFDSIEAYLEERLKGSGTDLAYLKQHGVYIPEEKKPLYLAPDEPHRFRTPSGKVELVSRQLEEAGFDPLPVYRPQPDPPAGSFRLLYGRSPLHTFGRTQNNAILADLVPGNCLWIHPSCAAKLGIRNGQPVFIKNARGARTGPLPARVTERMPERAVYTVHGFGHRSRDLSRACCTGGSDSLLIENYAVDPISGCTGMRTEFVTLESADPDRELYPCATG